MKWPTWNQAVAAAAVAVVVALASRRWRPDSKRWAAASAASFELALLASLYALWRLARELPLTHTDGALARAREIDRIQQEVLHLPSELGLQRFALEHEWLGQFVSTYYATVHVPALVIFLIWLYVRHRDEYPHWRNGLVILTAACLAIRFVRVAPPRFFPDLGYIDLSAEFGFDLYGPVGTGVSDQFAAMPSIHVGWAAVVSFAIFAVCTGWWRWLFLLHVVITMVAVSATGNHWWLDGIVAIVILGAALVVDTRLRTVAERRRARAPAFAAVPALAAGSLELEPADA